MQNKRYQVFVSSTFADLKDERRSVIETLLNLDCIPAGMEWFGAIDEEQFEFIKKVIDDCDYYVVIIGGRYGTVDPKGLSYTEKEYEYALSKKLKVLAFIHKDPEAIASGKTDQDAEARKKLDQFKERLKKGRLVEFWEGKDQLAGKVAVAMSKAIQMHPALGWVRADQVATVENLAELNELRKENEKLRKSVAESGRAPRIEDIAGLDEPVLLSGGTSQPTLGGPSWEGQTSWREIFTTISPFMIGEAYESHIRQVLASALCSLKPGEIGFGDRATLDSSFQKVRVQLVALNLVEIARDKKGNAVWRLTKGGEALMLELNVARTKPQSSSEKRATRTRPTKQPQ